MTTTISIAKALPIIVASALLTGCGREDGKPRTGDEGGRNAIESGAQALENLSSLAQELNARVESSKSEIAKLGNKTRKRLKPRMEAVDSIQAEIKAGIERLKASQESEISAETERIKAGIDSVTLILDQARKFFR